MSQFGDDRAEVDLQLAAELIPALGSIIGAGLGRYLEEARHLLAEPFRARGRRRSLVEAATRAAVAFHVWRALAPIGDDDAAELAAGLVERAVA